MSYDSTGDTLKHIMKVCEYLGDFCAELLSRGSVHDLSKLGPDEKPLFDQESDNLKNLVYGSDEYFESLARLKPAIDHHVTSNSHHPEYYSNGIDGMDLGDVVEMFFDWKAASERGKDADFLAGLKHNKERFGMSDQLYNIFVNTANRRGWGD